ncbi:class I adenylate-forming enzyme family protein [Streptomyces rhizosphaericola]|uniref:class I adenylate-forming enzyme family protein n=1 Tax=Streptomyces TaxID=1883 RepID=UPI000491F1C5|nr:MULTISPECIES: class I adenylate-forming enzyme family protein [unclassified Streptomyces]MYT93057.1 AMP-binding protein [Streptomyces sp. SID8359]
MSEISLLHDVLDAAAERWPDRPAVSGPGATVTYAELRDSSLRLAARLHSEGVCRGRRLVISLPSGPLVPALVFAASRVGAVYTVLHEQVVGVPLEHVLDDCEPTLVVADDTSVLDTAHARGITAVPGAEARDTAFTGTVAPTPSAEPLPAPLAVDPLSLIYTSGTTSAPKAVVSTHQQAVFAARAIQRALGYRADDIVYCPLPLSFDYGLYQLFLGALGGAHVVLGSPAEAGPTLLRNLLESDATVLAAVPSVAESLAWLLKRASRRPALRLVTNTGAALATETLNALRAAIPGLKGQVMFGLTECKRATIMPPDGDLQRPGSCGLPLPGTEVFTVDEEGNRLPAGETGEITVRGPHVMSGYWRRPELNRQRFPLRDGLFPELRTGDYGRLDEDGYLYFSGRRDDLYKERGFRVSATEVEAAAHRIPEIVSAAVLPPAGKKSALLVVVTGLEPGTVLERMQDQIEQFKIPRRCVVLDALPLSRNGKVDRKELTALLEGRDHHSAAGASPGGGASQSLSSHRS